MATAKDSPRQPDAAPGWIEPEWDEPVKSDQITHVLAARPVNSLADLEGERQPAVAVHPNGMSAENPKPVPTVPDPAYADLDLKVAPLSKDADTRARSGSKASEKA